MKVVYRFPAAQIFRFSFGQVSRTGDEATDGSGTLDVAIAVVINIDPPTYLLSADTVITVSLSGGNATRRSMNIVCVYNYNVLRHRMIIYCFDVCFFCCFLLLTVGQDFSLSQSTVTLTLVQLMATLKLFLLTFWMTGLLEGPGTIRLGCIHANSNVKQNHCIFTSYNSFVVLQNTCDPNVNTNSTANSLVIMSTGKY